MPLSHAGLCDAVMTTPSCALDVRTASDSTMTVSLVDAVLGRVSMYRAALGAMQNRLDMTRNDLSGSVEAASAARSLIRDADFAEESSNLARIDVVRQAGTAMLTQANASSSRALDLLR